MKYLSYKLKSTAAFLCAMLLFSCETEFVNPNAPTDAQILSSRDGLLNLSVGVLQLYSTSGLRFIIETPAITAREAAITTTFQNMIELEEGGSTLPNFNSNVEGLWANMLRVMRICDDLIANAERVELAAGTRSGILAHAHVFKAMAIGALAQNYEQVIIAPSVNNDARFVSRLEGYQEAIRLLEAAQQVLQTTPVSDEFNRNVLLGNIDLLNVARVYAARYNLFAGNYDAALEAAGNVDLSSVSNFRYDILNPNPIWGRVIQNNVANFKPRDGFGLPAELAPEPNDGRLAFYMIPLEETNPNGLTIENLRGFFTLDTQPIPVYLPGEVELIFAEARARKGELALAITALNNVRTKTNDRFGINAGLPPYSGPTTEAAVLLEIYKNRRAELFLSGMSLEDSRRFNRPAPSGTPAFASTSRPANS